MKLKEWRLANGLTQGDLVKRLRAVSRVNVTQQHVSKWESGVLPRRKARAAIEKLTGGEVKPESFLMDCGRTSNRPRPTEGHSQATRSNHT